MKTANIQLSVNKQTQVPKVGVTPAEVALLRGMFQNKVGSDPIAALVAGSDVERSSEAEKKRLVGLYGKDRVEKAFPGLSPTLPSDFGGIAAPVAAPKLTAPPAK